MTPIEDLLLATLDAVSRFRVGQREAVSGALDAGLLLTQAKERLPFGGWGEWMERVSLSSRTASTWMRLAKTGLSAEEVIARGGINATLAGKPRVEAKGSKSATVADLELAEEAVGIAKRAYYDALNARHRALRAVARDQGGNAGPER